MAWASRLAMIAAVAGLAGCDTIGNPLDALSGKKKAPDEFQVLARKPLVMPAAAVLPVPQPGMPSPLEPDPEADAQAALGGIQGGANVPGSTSISRGEAALLAAADAQAANPEIRTQLVADQAEIEANEPYEPPTIVELLSFGDDEEDVDPETVLDPVAESQRLQTAGYRAPNDPTAEPVDPDADQLITRGPSTTGNLSYVGEGNRPPRNTLVGRDDPDVPTSFKIGSVNRSLPSETEAAASEPAPEAGAAVDETTTRAEEVIEE